VREEGVAVTPDLQAAPPDQHENQHDDPGSAPHPEGATPLVKPYYQDDAVTIYHGDCREFFPEIIPLHHFDAVLTDPPYGVSYEGYEERWEAIVGDHSDELARWLVGQGFPCLVTFGAHEFPHLLTPGGRWWCWDKRLTEQADKMFGSPFELAWSPSTGKNVMLRCLHGGLVNANDPGYGRSHPTEKPVALLRQILSYLPAGAVFDPFAGSGTTLRAAKDLGRKAIGIEIEERYCEIAAKRCAQEVLDLTAGGTP
jgi:site-specific DNA-methyltransferase (adenine-specific)